MFTASDLCRTMAPMLALQETSLRQLQDPALREMREQIPEHPQATAKTAAILIIAGMTGGNRGTVAQRLRTLWEARPMGGPRAIENSASLGEALVLILKDAKMRAQLLHFDIDPANTAAIFVWKTGKPSVFHPHDPAEWEERVRRVSAAGGTLMTLKRLPATTFDRLAKTLAAAEALHPPGQA